MRDKEPAPPAIPASAAASRPLRRRHRPPQAVPTGARRPVAPAANDAGAAPASRFRRGSTGRRAADSRPRAAASEPGAALAAAPPDAASASAAFGGRSESPRTRARPVVSASRRRWPANAGAVTDSDAPAVLAAAPLREALSRSARRSRNAAASPSEPEVKIEGSSTSEAPEPTVVKDVPAAPKLRPDPRPEIGARSARHTASAAARAAGRSGPCSCSGQGARSRPVARCLGVARRRDGQAARPPGPTGRKAVDRPRRRWDASLLVGRAADRSERVARRAARPALQSATRAALDGPRFSRRDRSARDARAAPAPRPIESRSAARRDGEARSGRRSPRNSRRCRRRCGRGQHRSWR